MEEYGNLDICWSQGYKGDDIFHVDLDTICHACGSTIKFIDLKQGEEVAFSCEGNGIKVIATNPYQRVFAVAEHGMNPKIFVYNYPACEIISILEGAELEYSNLAFSQTKSYLAACSGIPDFSLFLWDWVKGELQCSKKLVDEGEITSLLFNPLNHYQISLIGPKKVTVWTIEICNDIASLKSMKIELPATDGVLVVNDDQPPSRSMTRMGYSLYIPEVIKAGLAGDKADLFQPPEFRKARVLPTAQCWSIRSEVFVGCKGGQLFKIEAESGQISVLLGVGLGDKFQNGEITEQMFSCMALNSRGIVAGGADCYLRLISFNKKGTNIEKLWKATQAPTTLTFNPATFTELLYGTKVGTIFSYDMVDPKSEVISECHNGRMVGVDYGGNGHFCVTCRDDGDIQVWGSDDGDFAGDLQLNDKITSMAYCPSCPVVVTGSLTGLLRYIDMTSLHGEEVELRQVMVEKIHHGEVSFLKYDSFGVFLLSASKDESEIFVFNAKPSSKFRCLGYVECGGNVKDLSIFTQGDQSHVAVIVSHSDKEREKQDNELILFTLSPDLLKEDEGRYASLRKNFKGSVINLSHHYLSVSADSAIITDVSEATELAVISRASKKLLKFSILQKEENQDGLCTPTSEHPGHQLGDGFLILSPHRRWLASSSKDGVVFIRDLIDWDSYVSVTAHSYMEGGTRSLTFSPDSKCIVTIGAEDNSINCFAWKFSEKGSIQAGQALEFSRVLNMRLRNSMEVESETLDRMLERNVLSQKFVLSGTEVDSKRDLEDQETLDVEDKSTEAISSLLMDEETTWMDERTAAALHEENSKYEVEKEHLRQEIARLRSTILEMMEVNTSLPELERLRQEEYNLDTEEQKRMQAHQDKEIQEVRDEINLENLAQRYMAYLIKKECWDEMETKGRSLDTFNHQVTVDNYPTIAITPDEEELVETVSRLRKIEISENAVRKVIVDATASKASAVGEEEEEEEEDQTLSLALHGSLGPKYNGESDLFYSQFELHTREEKFNQIVLIKDAVNRIKKSFNESFNGVFRNKEQEIARIKERNVRIRTIMEELNMGPVCVADPELNKNEMPEKIFDVKDDEVTVERVLSEEQKREKEERERMEEERKAKAKGDNKRERALMDMMGGVLEVKKEDILKQDIPPPDFSVEKAEKDWTDEEKKKWKEYEKKQKELQEEREKYRKNLENELKKLQQANLDGMTSFDESLTALFNKKVKVEMVLNQEELKVLRLAVSIVTDDELASFESHLNFLFGLKKRLQSEAESTETEIRKKLDDCREFYDSVVAEDKMLDRSFKRDFSDVPLSLSDQLYKLFKRRPRLQRQQKTINEKLSYDPFGLAEKVILPQSGDNTAALQALSDLDNSSYMLEGLDEVVWERMCESRRIKYESELRVKQTAMTLAEMTQYYQHRQDELERLNRDIDDVIKQQTKLYEDIMKNSLNLEVQLLLKQGQVEVPCGQFIPNYSESILIHRGVVEDLNGTIRTLGESKVAAMTESKDFKKGIHQLEWERKRMIMMMEDLMSKARHIQMLKLTKEIQAFLNDEHYSSKQAKEVSVLEQTLALLDQQLDNQIGQKEYMASQLTQRLRSKQEENKELDKILEELHVAVSERYNIASVNADERAKNTADKRLRGIINRRKLVDLAKGQAQEVAVLRAEVERLRMKTFPALVQVER